jgi:hypothetical protein
VTGTREVSAELSVTDPCSMSEAELLALFDRIADPYRAGAAALFSKDPAVVTQDERDAVKIVFMHITHWRREQEAKDRMACTGSLVHDEFTICPIHDQRRP